MFSTKLMARQRKRSSEVYTTMRSSNLEKSKGFDTSIPLDCSSKDNQISSKVLKPQCSLRVDCNWDKFAGILEEINSNKQSLGSHDFSDILPDSSNDTIIHDAISLGAPENILMQLAEIFPSMLSRQDDKARYPLHLACASGSSMNFISRCVDMCPASACAKDSEGKTAVHHLCQSYIVNRAAEVSKFVAVKRMTQILRVLYQKAPASTVAEDHEGIGAIEYALDSGVSIEFIRTLQRMISHYHRTEEMKKAHRKCDETLRRMKRTQHALAA